MDYKNILLIKMSSLGDVIHTLPFVFELRKLYPKSKITWLVHPQFGEFIPLNIVDEIMYFDRANFGNESFLNQVKDLWAMRKKLRAKNFDLVIDLQGLFKSAVMAILSGCKNRIGYCNMREGSQFISKPIVGENANGHAIERYLDVARFLGAKVENVQFPLPSLENEEKNIKEKLTSFGCENGYIVVVPGARWQTKCWPEEYYAELIKKIVADDKFVVLAGSKEDEKKGERISEKVANEKLINLVGKTNLKELLALIKNCQVYISGDTGPLHFAAALKKPLVCMYGPTKADRTGPYGSINQTIIHSSAKCAGCLKKQCSDWHCMYDISVEEVYAAYLEKLSENK